jgi:hypothetical protein
MEYTILPSKEMNIEKVRLAGDVHSQSFDFPTFGKKRLSETIMSGMKHNAILEENSLHSNLF